MMSAIFGIWHIDGRKVSKEYLQIMQEKVIQYGRDRQDLFIKDNLGLGCCLSRLRTQPEDIHPVFMDDNGEKILVADAQIYNRAELINEHALTDNEDMTTQALIMRAWLRWSPDAPLHINGDFAFALWEPQQNRLLLARDHLGVRPLYYYYDTKCFVFATDIRAILALPFIPKKINEMMLYRLLTGNNTLDPENTYIQNLNKIPQAHVFTVNGNGLNRYKYFTPGAGKKIIFATEAAYGQALYDVVEGAIKRRLHNAQGRIGAEMSGGLDASVITILANRALRKEHQQLTLYSWSPSFELLEKQPRDERELIELVCRQESLECTYAASDIFSEQNLVEGDRAGSSPKPRILSSELELMTSAGVQLVLSGWGGDQGISHRANLFELFVNGYLYYFFKEAKYLAGGSLISFLKVIIANTVLRLFSPYSYFGRPNKGMTRIINQDFAKSMKKDYRKQILYFTIDPVKHLESGNIQTRTEKSAEAGADYNIQYLFPFLDYQVVDFAMSIPRHLFYKQGLNRYIYRKAFASILPEKLCYYKYKDDIARGTYYKRQKRMPEQLKQLKELDRALFAKYIDFNQLAKFSEAFNTEEPAPADRKVMRSIRTCLEIQGMLT